MYNRLSQAIQVNHRKINTIALGQPKSKKYILRHSKAGMAGSNRLTQDKLQELVQETVQTSVNSIPGTSEEQKREWCVNRLTQLLETFDNYTPVIGMFLDNPIADDLEKQAVKLLVDWAWDNFKNSGESIQKQ